MAYQRQRVCRQILAYLINHPDAQDTAEGIAQWWLLEQRIQQALGEVQDALTELLENEFIAVQVRQGMPAVYRVNVKRLEEIRNLLSKEL